jgi:urea carboxylase system permease
MSTQSAIRTPSEGFMSSSAQMPETAAAGLSHRSMGSFSAFAASFSGLSVITGLFQVWFIGYAFAGPGFIWFWPVVFAGQLAVALVFAEMAARFPLAGSAYQWGKLLGGRTWGWNTGWLYLLAQLLTLPAVVVAMQLTLPALWSGFSFSDDFAKNAVILGIIALAVVTIINLAGVRIMALVNDIGVAAEILSIVALIALLAIHLTRGPEVLVETNGTEAGHSWGYLGALLVAGFMSLYNMYAFDTAATLAEETQDPQRNAPRAVLRSLIAAGVIGMIVLVLSVMVIPDLTAPELSTEGLPFLIKSVLGNTVGTLLLISVTVAILVCALALQAWSARTVFAMGRDGELPGGNALGRVNASKVPVRATLVTAVVGLLILAINLNNPKAFNVIVALGIVFIYLAYLGVTLVGLRRRAKGWPHDGGKAEGLFTMPRPVGRLVNGFAVAYGVLMLVNLAWPRKEFYGSEWYQQYAVIIFVPVLTLLGVLYFLLVQRRRVPIDVTSEVLEDEVQHEVERDPTR